MAPTLQPRSPIVARAEHLSPGAIAGAVVGSVVGGSILFLVLGFLYFRYQRRLREAQADGPLDIPKGHVGDHSSSSPWQGVLPGQTSTAHSAHPPSDKDLGSERAVPALGDSTDQHQSPVSPHGDDWMRHNAEFYPHQVSGQDSLPQDVDFSLPARDSTDPNTPVAANSEYYDMRISMHSEPEQPYLPPSRQMSELYRAQLRDAEEHKKRSGSFTRRILESFKRKRSTQSSGRSQEAAPSPPQQYFPVSPVDSPIGIKQEPGAQLPVGAGSQAQPGENRLFAEPEELPESVAPGTTGAASASASENYPQHHKRQKRWTRDSQYGDSPLRTDSAIRETTERDPELPSAALRTDSTYGLPPAAQPPPPVQPQERLKSPDIPEPMDIDGHQSQLPDQSVFRGSHSPPLPPESFVVPMAVMQPTNALEKAAYTDYQMENSASPPAISPTHPDIITDQLSHIQDDDLNLVSEHDFADKYLDLPDDDDEPRLSGDSYEYSTYSTTTPGQSSTDPSCGRTPDTRITASPSPFPTVPEHVKVEISPSTSPEVMRLSPQGAPLTCEDCGRQFDQIHKLNHHKRYHDRKHECPYEGCDKKFGTKTHLDRHINDKHEKLKAYHCTEPTCPYFKGGKFFARKDNWRRHMVKKHGAGAQDLEAMDESHG